MNRISRAQQPVMRSLRTRLVELLDASSSEQGMAVLRQGAYRLMVRLTWESLCWPISRKFPWPACAFAALAIVQSIVSAYADDQRTPQITLTILADPALKIPGDDPVVFKRLIRVYGRRVPNMSVLIDSKTRGLGNVFVWTPVGMSEESKLRQPRTHYLYLANGNFVPTVIVAYEGDELQVSPIDHVALNPITDFREKPGSHLGRFPRSFLLTEPVNQPVSVTCSHLPWLRASVFVQRGVECTTTDRLGLAVLPVRSVDGAMRVFLEHDVLGRLHVLQAPEGVEQVEQGVIEIAPAVVRRGEEIVLTVTEEGRKQTRDSDKQWHDIEQE